jgi:hypothetical protein
MLLVDTLPSLLGYAWEPRNLSCYRHPLLARLIVFLLPLLFFFLFLLLLLLLAPLLCV